MTSITTIRKELFKAADAALAGETVTFTHKGVQFKIVPEIETDILKRITPLQIVNPENSDLDTSDLKKEMEEAWTKDWANI